MAVTHDEAQFPMAPDLQGVKASVSSTKMQHLDLLTAPGVPLFHLT